MKRFFLYSGLALAMSFFTTATYAQNDRRGRQEPPQQKRPMNSAGSNRMPNQPMNRPPAPQPQQNRPEQRHVNRPSQPRQPSPVNGGLVVSNGKPSTTATPTGYRKPADIRPALGQTPSSTRLLPGGGGVNNKPTPASTKPSVVFKPSNTKPTLVNTKPTPVSTKPTLVNTKPAGIASGVIKQPVFTPGKVNTPTISGGSSSLIFKPGTPTKPGSGTTVGSSGKPSKKININVVLGLGALAGFGLLDGGCPGHTNLSGPMFPGSGGSILGNSVPPTLDNGFLQGSCTDGSLPGGSGILDNGSSVTLPEGNLILPGNDSSTNNDTTNGSDTDSDTTQERADTAGTLAWHHEQGSLTRLADGTWQEKVTTENSLHLHSFKLMDQVGDAIYLYDAERELTIRIQNDEVHGKQPASGVNEFTLMYKGGWKK